MLPWYKGEGKEMEKTGANRVIRILQKGAITDVVYFSMLKMLLY